MVKLWALFGVRSESEPRPYFIGIYETLEAAALARAQAASWEGHGACALVAQARQASLARAQAALNGSLSRHLRRPCARAVT